MYKSQSKSRKLRPDPPPVSESSVYSKRAIPGIEREPANEGTERTTDKQQKPGQG